MKKVIRIIYFFSLTFCFQTTHAQEMTDQQRAERCQNNRNRLAELETQLNSVNAGLSQAMTAKEAERRRDQLAYLKQLKTKVTYDPYGSSWDPKKLAKISADYNFNMDECLGVTGLHSTLITCLNSLEKIIANKIDKARSINNPALTAKKNEIEKQIASHRNNIIALGCNHSSTTKGGGKGSWTLVSVTVNPENPKVPWPHNEWNYSAESPSAHYSINNGAYKADFNWTPPQEFTSSGFTISLNVQGNTKDNQAISQGICVSGSNVTSVLRGDELCASAQGKGSVSAQKSVIFKPIANSSDIIITVSMGWAVTYTYKYHRS